ncbi:hypothetical protein M427DRAFT_226353 [Gonapodya prolifera JEL478]|uniref:PLAC8-domain-containing protein n=1 Tax=Gonapodya prolifera (strain JEL478) TaxID=1344416 RepID=A0A139ANH5_GONPJ|nr:hypothetical protein M427DRAFT_226353 [Gonapodya prolifera JEL478]|eukprot:KXS18286.1 hypothetical protein M427DRAFT_226353 [Gonapodya prolifera JEL478]
MPVETPYSSFFPQRSCLSMVGLCAIVATSRRGRVRANRGIEGSGASDCFTTCCCETLALTQEKHEIQKYPLASMTTQQPGGYQMAAPGAPVPQQKY